MNVEASSQPAVEKVVYDDQITRWFVIACIAWGIIGMLAGVWLALELAWWPANVSRYLTFGRLRPVHTDAVIFAFAGNAIFAAIYYSTQRLLKTRMLHDGLSRFHFWGWQSVIVLTAITLPLGITQGKEYAEMEWPIDLLITVVWVAFAVNFFGALWKRREQHIYVAVWFYIATIVTIAVLHIVNNLVIPVSLTKSYPIFSGVQDAMVQWWYGHNAVAFFLTTPFLGLMYYFLPKAANRPIFSYKLSIVHFWSLVFLYIWAGPHHLHYTALPEWASTLGMAFSIMLWMPSWGGMINGLFTLRGAWHKLRDDPVLKFFVVGITFYGMATFEGPMISIKLINSLSHYTDWTIAHVHAGALGWNGFMTFGMAYWLMPRLWKTKLWSPRLANIHFWIGTFGILLYIAAMYFSGITQGLMWRAFDDTGRLMYPDFMETVINLIPFYWLRLVGGTMFLIGAISCAVNLFMTIRNRGDDLSDTVVEVPAPMWKRARRIKREPTRNYDEALFQLDAVVGDGWHRALEARTAIFTVLTLVAILIGTVVEFVPTVLLKPNVPTIKTVQPYTPLELEGRDIYVREGCYNCHSQMIRPLRHEIMRYGEYSKPAESMYDHPFQWGSKRNGPDLARVGGKYVHLWHVRHMEDPRSTTPNSVMPPYPWLLEDTLDLSDTQTKVDVMVMLNVPYSGASLTQASELARTQAQQISDEIVAQGGPDDLADKEIVALIAYLQRLGTDIFKEGERR